MEPEGRRGLRHAVVAGVKWTSAGSAVAAGVQLVRMILLAHLLAPREFGLMAAVLTLLGAAQAFGDMGLSNAIVVRRNISREVLSSLYWANVAAGACISLLVLAATPLITSFYGEPELSSLVPWAASAFLVSG